MSNATLTLPLTESAVLQGTLRLGGLCRDCRLAETCTFPRDLGRPVRSCDEFDPLPDVHPPPLVSRRSFPEEMPNTEEAFIGLCKHCTRRSTCHYPKPLGGVWHCDELA